MVAHVDAGKTTTTEQLLYLCGRLRRPGSVDEGTAQTDWLPVERERGISVSLATTLLERDGVRINLIDTPGHADFAGEVERVLSILDGAVLILSAAEGVQAQTELLWKALASLEIPVVLYLNKVDRAGCDQQRIDSLIRELETGFSIRTVPLTAVDNPGSRDCAVRPLDLSSPAVAEELAAVLGEADDRIAEDYLLGEMGRLTPRRLEQALAEQTARRQVFPLVLGASARGQGVEPLLHALIRCLPVNQVDPEDSRPLSGVVYKVEHDLSGGQAMGKVAHLRLFSGHIRNRDVIPLLLEPEEDALSAQPVEAEEKVTQIRRFSGQRHQDIGFLAGGDIGAVYGLTRVKTGAVIGRQPLRRPYPLATPLFTVQVFPQQQEQLTSLVQAMRELSEEDPLLDLVWLKEERELHIRIMGTIQLEVLQSILWERYHLKAVFSPPSVIYRETVSRPGEGYEAYTMPKPCWAIVRLAFEPLPRGSGIRYRSAVKDNVIPSRYQNHIALSIPQALRQGLYGWEVTDTAVTLIDGGHHHVHTHPLDFFVATPMAVMDGLHSCGTTLLEPVQLLRITADETYLGKIIGEVLAMRGEFEPPSIHLDSFTMEARVPVAASMDFPVWLASLTGGTANLTAGLDGYQPCPPELGRTAKRRGIDPTDRAKWILHARSAL